MDSHPSNLVSSIRSGDPRALARAISVVENHAAGWVELLKELFPHTGCALTIGITGSPGAGKSTLVDQLAKLYRKTKKAPFPAKDPTNREPQELETSAYSTTATLDRVPDDDCCKVGIIAVDPSSPYSGGAILGDRIRMQEHFSDPGIFIRSMATRGSLGGLARTTADVATVLDAAGHDIVMIETVGVGQDEIDIVRVADVTIVILVPGMGDDVQSMKAGVMEIADIFVINKSDHEGAERIEKEIRALQSLATRQDGWVPPVVRTVATQGAGIHELAQAIADYGTFMEQADSLAQSRIAHWEARLIEMLRDSLLERARGLLTGRELTRLATDVAEHKRDPYSVIEEIARGL